MCPAAMPMQRRANRPDLAIGNIVDLRPHAGRDLSDTFGLYLGFTHAVCRGSDLTDFLAARAWIASQNRASRHRDGIAQTTLAWMFAASIGGRFRKGRISSIIFTAKEIPLTAGLSERESRRSAGRRRCRGNCLRDYIRVSPTGPMAPLVLSATTVGSKMNLAITYRSALLDQAGADAVA